MKRSIPRPDPGFDLTTKKKELESVLTGKNIARLNSNESEALSLLITMKLGICDAKGTITIK